MRFLSFGSLNLDHIYAVPHHVKTGETLTSVSFETLPGGKGLNQSIALKKAGAEVFHAGNIGEDGMQLKCLLENEGINVSFLSIVPHPTGHAIIQVNDEGDNCILLYPGANRCVTENQIENVFSCFGKGDILVLQNEINGLESMIKHATAREMSVVLNPSPMDETILDLPLDQVSVLLLNEIEGSSITSYEKPEQILDELACRYPQMHIVLTLGSKGSYYRHGNKCIFQNAYTVNAIDTTAAGDTYTGYFLQKFCGGSSPEEAMSYASAASAIAVTKKGAAQSIPCHTEVDEWLLKVNRDGFNDLCL